MQKAPRSIAALLVAVFTLLLAGDVGAATICIVRQSSGMSMAMGSKCMKSGTPRCNCSPGKMATRTSGTKQLSPRSHDCPFRKLLYKPASSSIQTTVQHQTDVTPAPVVLPLPMVYDVATDIPAATQASIPPDLVILHRNLRI